ncbi:hypothetical protein PSPO01_16270 [Paraphaeosphaeria sporulosa]
MSTKSRSNFFKKMPITRRKTRKTTPARSRTPRTARRELAPETKAYAVGAMTAGVSQYSLTKELPVTQAGLSWLLARTRERSEVSKFPLWDPHLYAAEPGRGPQEQPLTQEQKHAVIAVATLSKDSREKQSWQAIADGDFDHLQLPKPLSRERRFQWALAHNPDKYEYGDGLGFDFRRVIYTDKTPARAGEQCGLLRAWAKDDEAYNPDVKRPKIRSNCVLQFYGSFTYDAKALPQARAALSELGEAKANSRAWAWTKQHELKRRDRSRGGVDGYRYREEVLKPLLVP